MSLQKSHLRIHLLFGHQFGVRSVRIRLRCDSWVGTIAGHQNLHAGFVVASCPDQGEQDRSREDATERDGEQTSTSESNSRPVAQCAKTRGILISISRITFIYAKHLVNLQATVPS